jgi:hypothetical protein
MGAANLGVADSARRLAVDRNEAATLRFVHRHLGRDGDSKTARDQGKYARKLIALKNCAGITQAAAADCESLMAQAVSFPQYEQTLPGDLGRVKVRPSGKRMRRWKHK